MKAEAAPPAAGGVIARLGLQPHPEGGWYRETWRTPPEAGQARGAATAILYLLEAGQRSHWHRVDAAELWLHHAGAALRLSTSWGTGVVEHVLGGSVEAGGQPQHLVEKGEWQSAEATDGWALVACVVVPAFEFSGFEVAPPGWIPG